MQQDSGSGQLQGLLREWMSQLTDPLQILISTREALEIELDNMNVDAEQISRFFELQRNATEQIQQLIHRAYPREFSNEDEEFEAPLPISAKVLIVESNEAALNSIAALFELMGVEVRLASSAQEAFTILSRSRDFDFIFADEFLHDMDGMRFLLDARNDYAYQGKTVLVQWPSLEREVDLNPEDIVLFKPFGRKEISEILRASKT